jgi:tRNA U34 5-methylaminomethyl-2-thiouridine-forming methyltransferase MnmC
MDFRPDILPTDDGSHTLRHPLLGDTYHSTRGAVGEAEHVFIRAGFDRVEAPHVRIFEMGFGSGLNALLTARRAREAGKTVDYHAVELYPVAPEVVARLNFSDDLLHAMHDAPWDEPVRIDDDFLLTKYQKSLAEIDFAPGTLFEAIYFDAFSPDTQPELWSVDVFRKLYTHTATGGVLVTYSAKGEVRRALQAAGYAVEKLEGALGKRHMLRAIRKA